MADWKVVGQVGRISKGKDFYKVDIAENKFKDDFKTKDWTIWFNCICGFDPSLNSINKGDTVIAEGTFKPSKNKNFPYIMEIKHIGKIKGNGK